MLKKIESLPTGAVLVILALATLACHWMLISVGILLHDSEWSAFLLAADWFREGAHHERHIDVFAFRQNYGGLTLTAIRALWINLFSEKQHLFAQMSFSYGVCPILTTWIFYAVARSVASRSSAFFTGLLVAIDFQGLVLYYGNDFYPLMLLLGAALLALRGKSDNPLQEFSPRRLFLAAILSGHLLFATRMGALYLAAFWVQWTWIASEWSAFKQSIAARKKLPLLALGLAAFGLYLEVFGRDLGTVFHRAIKIDGLPNIKIALAIYTLFRIWELRAKILKKPFPKKIAVALSGAVIGFLPELIYQFKKGRVVSDQVLGHQSFAEFWHVLGVLPSSLKLLVTGSAPFRMLEPKAEHLDPGIGAVFSIIAVLLAIYALYTRSKKDFRARPYLLLLALNLFAFCWIWTPYLELGPPRYLYPAFVGFCAGFAVLIDSLSKKTRYFSTAVIAVLVFSSVHQLNARCRLVDQAKSEGKIEKLEMIVATFRDAKVNTVVSDDFWYSNNLTLLANANPGFWPSWRDWGPEDIRTRAHTTKRAGILLERKNGRALGATLTDIPLLGRNWHVQFLRTVGDRDLYLGYAL